MQASRPLNTKTRHIILLLASLAATCKPALGFAPTSVLPGAHLGHLSLSTAAAAHRRPCLAAAAAAPRTRGTRGATGLFMIDLFGGMKEKLSQATSEVTVQHILLDTEPVALELRRTIEKDKKGLSVESFGEYAREHSTCGSSKKTPDAKMSQLRGNPGEMKFLRATVDKAFGDAAFSSQVGKLCGPIKSQYGYHLLVVRERSDGFLGGSSPEQEPIQNEVGNQGGKVADELQASSSKSASKKKNKAASKSKKNGKGKQ